MGEIRMSKEEKIIKIAKKKIKETGLDINLIFKLPEEFEIIKHKYDVAAGGYLGNKTIYLNLNTILNTIQHYKLPANDIIDVVLAHEIGHAIDPEFDFLSHQYNTLFDEYEKLVVPVWDDIDRYVEFLHSNDGQVLIDGYLKRI